MYTKVVFYKHVRGFFLLVLSAMLLQSCETDDSGRDL